MPKKRRKKFIISRFWAAVRVPFFGAGVEVKRLTPSKRRRPRKALSTIEVEARIRRELEAEMKASETPTDRVLRQVQEEAEKKFRASLRRGDDLGEAGFWAVAQIVAGNMRRKKP